MSVQSSVGRAIERHAKWWRWPRVPLALVTAAGLLVAVVTDNNAVAAIAALMAAGSALGLTTMAGAAGESAHRAGRATAARVEGLDGRLADVDRAVDELRASMNDRIEAVARDAHRSAMSELVVVIGMQPRMPETLDLAVGAAQDLAGAEIVAVDRSGDAAFHERAREAATTTPGLRIVKSSQSLSIQEDVNAVLAETGRRCLAVFPRAYQSELAAAVRETRPLLPFRGSQVAARAPSEHPRLVCYEVAALREVEGFVQSVELTRELTNRLKAAGYTVDV